MFRRTDIPFAADETQRFLPWLSGIMVGLAVFLLCIGLSLNHWAAGKHVSYSGSFTVNIPASGNNAERVVKITDMLRKNESVKTVSQISKKSLQDMLKPWMGDGPIDDLPIPTVLDVTLSDAAKKIDYAALEKSFSDIAPGTEIDAHERWVNSFAEFSSTLRRLTTGLAILVIAALGMTIAFTSRASLKLHNQAVHLLHSIGAEEGYIVRQFQQEAARILLPGAIAGCVISGLLYWAVSRYVASLQISLLPPMAITASHIWLLVLMPPLCIAAAWLVARVSISVQLRRIL